MKFDLDRAWKETTGLLTGNLGLLVILAGVFVFLPYAALTLMVEGGDLIVPSQPPQSPEAMIALMMDFYRRYWWAVLAVVLMQTAGTLSMIALVKRKPRPTVGEALGAGLRAVLPYVGAQLIQSAVLVVVAGAVIGVTAAAGFAPLTIIGLGAAVTLFIYVFTRLSLVAPVMTVDGVLNPVAAMVRSWALTRGNAARVLSFYLLIFIAFLVVSMIVSMLLTLFFALFGQEAATFGAAVGSAVVNAASIALLTALLAAVHAQLTRLNAPKEPDMPVI